MCVNVYVHMFCSLCYLILVTPLNLTLSHHSTMRTPAGTKLEYYPSTILLKVSHHPEVGDSEACIDVFCDSLCPGPANTTTIDNDDNMPDLHQSAYKHSFWNKLTSMLDPCELSGNIWLGIRWLDCQPESL